MPLSINNIPELDSEEVDHYIISSHPQKISQRNRSMHVCMYVVGGSAEQAHDAQQHMQCLMFAQPRRARQPLVRISHAPRTQRLSSNPDLEIQPRCLVVVLGGTGSHLTGLSGWGAVPAQRGITLDKKMGAGFSVFGGWEAPYSRKVVRRLSLSIVGTRSD